MKNIQIIFVEETGSQGRERRGEEREEKGKEGEGGGSRKEGESWAESTRFEGWMGVSQTLRMKSTAADKQKHKRPGGLEQCHLKLSVFFALILR